MSKKDLDLWTENQPVKKVPKRPPRIPAPDLLDELGVEKMVIVVDPRHLQDRSDMIRRAERIAVQASDGQCWVLKDRRNAVPYLVDLAAILKD